MPPEKKNKKNEVTLKEASSELDLSESTIKKYLKDFDLEKPKGLGGKAVISDDTFKVLSEIAKLRANGLSIQEIKELRSQEPSKTVLDEMDEGPKLSETTSTESEEKQDITSENELSASLLEDAIGESEQEEKDVKSSGESGTCEEGEDAEKDIEGEETQEEGDGGTRRRRLFNYRYVERQISNDSKRVGWLRQRLRNPHLSPRDKLFFEEALERRILFLDGWKHILRWVSTK